MTATNNSIDLDRMEIKSKLSAPTKYNNHFLFPFEIEGSGKFFLMKNIDY